MIEERKFSSLNKTLEIAYHEVRGWSGGDLSKAYPILTRSNPALFGLSCIFEGEVFSTGDSGARFPIMSVAKPFAFALACESAGVASVTAEVGMNATGTAFNAVGAVEKDPHGIT